MINSRRVVFTISVLFLLSIALFAHLALARDNTSFSTGQDNGYLPLSSTMKAELGYTVYPGDITPPERPRGLAWDEGSFWVAFDTDPAQIAQLDPNGQVVTTFAPPAGTKPEGLDCDGENLWLFDGAAGVAYHLATDGSLLGQVNLPAGTSAGLAWDGSALWAINWSGAELYRIDPTSGEILKTITTTNLGSSAAYGLAWFKDFLWASNADGIYKINSDNGMLVAVYKTVFDTGTSLGLTWDGQDLWGAGGSSYDLVKLDVSDGALTKAVPTVYTGSAGANEYNATIYGSVRPNGLSTKFFFQMGRSYSLDFQTVSVDIGAGFDYILVWANFFDLAPRTRYYYRVGATNSMGTQYGQIKSFRTDDDNHWLDNGGCLLRTIRLVEPD